MAAPVVLPQVRRAIMYNQQAAARAGVGKADVQNLMNENGTFSFFINVWKFYGTVIPHILPQVFLATLVAVGVWLVWRYHSTSFLLFIPTNGHTLLGT